MNLSELNPPIMNSAGTLVPQGLHRVRDVYGALVTKTITWEPRKGNDQPWYADTPSGMMNRVGLKNPGFEAFMAVELDYWDVGLPVVVSIWGGEGRPLSEMCRYLDYDERVAAVELNLSCPNIDNRYSTPLTVSICRSLLRNKPLFVKAAAGNEAIKIAAEASGYGIDALTLINTVPALTWRPGVAEPFLGGLSREAIKPIALRAVWEARQANKYIPIIGVGGITRGKDIHEFIRAGATAVQIGSGSFIREPRDIIREYEEDKK